MDLYSSTSPSYMVTENKYDKQKLNKRNKNTAQETGRIYAAFDIGN